MTKTEQLQFKLAEILKEFKAGRPDISILKLDQAYKILLEELKKLNANS